MKLISNRTFSQLLIPKMDYKNALKVGFEEIKFGPGKYEEFSDLRDLAPVSRGKKGCTSQNARITIVELVHRRPLADLV